MKLGKEVKLIRATFIHRDMQKTVTTNGNPRHRETFESQIAIKVANETEGR